MTEPKLIGLGRRCPVRAEVEFAGEIPRDEEGEGVRAQAGDAKSGCRRGIGATISGLTK